MDWQKIIDSGELIYASKPQDEQLRKWSLKTTRCEVSGYDTFPLDDIDVVICSVLKEHNGELSELDLATILGFNVVDNFDSCPKRYADKAELTLFRKIAQSVIDWGLILRVENSCFPTVYSLTSIGQIALDQNQKFKFYTGRISLYENFGINADGAQEGPFFPFQSALNIQSVLTEKTDLSYEFVPNNFNILDDSELAMRISSQSSGVYNFFSIRQTSWYDITSCNVDYRIYCYDKNSYPLIFVDGRLSWETTDLLNRPYNAALKLNKVEWGNYLHLLNDDDAIISYKSLRPFLDILSPKDILKVNHRLKWDDADLFEFFVKAADAADWRNISMLFPVQIIENNIDKTYFWDWLALSKRLSAEFVIKHSSDYNWNFNLISNRDDFEADDYKKLLDNEKLKYADWDWERLLPILGQQYVVDNIDRLDFDLNEFTRNEITTASLLIPQYPQKNWDFKFISAIYDVPFIIEHISDFETEDENGKHHNKLDLLVVLKRACSSTDYVDMFCDSAEVHQVYLDNHYTFSGYSANNEIFAWTDNLIKWCESLEIIQWNSGRYVSGFEVNQALVWNNIFFATHSGKITSDRGFSHISSKIIDCRLVDQYSDFQWDWDAISSNINLISNKNFVKKHLQDFNLNVLLPKIEVDFLTDLFENNNLANLLDENGWLFTTNIAPVEFVRRHLDYKWEWHILTKRFYATLNINAIGNPKWIEKWDWVFLTKNLDADKILTNLDDYKEYWDWPHLTVKLDKEFILNNLADFYDYWNWGYLLDKRLDCSDLSFSNYLPTIAACLSKMPEDDCSNYWTIITRKFTYDELDDLIRITFNMHMTNIFKWDYLDFYNRDEFNLREYLKYDIELIDWHAISGCNKIEKEFSWDDKLFSEKIWFDDVSLFLKDEDFKWDFKELSKVQAFYSRSKVLTIKPRFWDWSYICSISPIFLKGENFAKNYRRFSKYLDYKVLSTRQDTGLKEQLIEEKISMNWDWDALSMNQSILFSIKFIKEQKDKPWNWQALSARNDIKLDNESLFELSDKDWSWEAISNRTDLVYDADFISHFCDKPLNWLKISSLNSFIPNSFTLSRLKGLQLNWKAISSNPHLDKDVLWDYRDLLDWYAVTRNIVNCSDSDFLAKYKDYLDWNYISNDPGFNVTDNNLILFKDKVIWDKINQRNDFKISERTLELFTDELDWSKISESHVITFTEALIEKYSANWDWTKLRKNSQVIDHLSDALSKYKAGFNCAEFVEQFTERKPYIYHFTHMFPNALDIIKSRKILSRNKSLGHFANAAGSNVNRRGTAHDFARFYYRPQTPTQFYNECLGMDKESGELKTWWYDGNYYEKWKSYYPQALRLELPKCPMPVFFKFSLEEVIAKMPDICYYSTGNMQTDRAEVIKVTDNPNRLNAQDLYSTVKDGVEVYKQYSQQEFLVLNEFDFSKLNDFQIICYDSEQANILKSQLHGDPICDKIEAGGNDIYHRNNRPLTITEDDFSISITSGYREDSACLSVRGDGISSVVVLNPDNIKRETASGISAYPCISLKKPLRNVEVVFTDERGREWIVYKQPDLNASSMAIDESPLDHFSNEKELRDLFNTQVRHYTIKEHTRMVCEQFMKYFNSANVPIRRDLLLVFLALHDIGKPIAEQAGNREEQYEYTSSIIRKVSLDCCGNHYTENDRKILLSLVQGDYIGEYFKGIVNVDKTVDQLSVLALMANMRLTDYLYLYMIYYQCDIASYTADAGGYKYLEPLFEYDNPITKTFDSDEGLIRMSENYWKKYIELKNKVYDRKNL